MCKNQYVSVSSAFIIFILLISGCASFTTEDTPKTDYITTSAKCKKKPTVSYNFLYRNMNRGYGHGSYGDDYVSNEKIKFEKILLDSSEFESVKENDSEADIQISIYYSIPEFEGTSFFNMITILTLFIIPSGYTTDIYINAEIIHNGENIDINDQYEISTVTWLPMLLIYPFTTVEQNQDNINNYQYMKIANKVISKMELFCKTS